MSFLDFFRARPDAEQARPSPKPDPQAIGSSGRGHADGFLELDELNADLQHPQCHEVFDTMYRTDGDCRQVVNLVCNPITGGTWAVQPHGGEVASDEDQQIAQALEWALFEVLQPNLIGHLIEFLPVLTRSGFVPGEIVWGAADWGGVDGKGARKLMVPRRIEMRLPRSVFRFEQRHGRLVAIHQHLPAWTKGGHGSGQLGGDAAGVGPTQSSDLLNGTVRIPSRNLVYYRLGAEGDNWEGTSLLRPAYKHWKIKDVVERIDAIAQEREALGVPVVYPPSSASSGQLDSIESALKNMRANQQGYIVMPGMKAGEGAPDGQGWLIELLGFDRSGSGRDPMPTLQWHSGKIAAAFISEFMRLGHGQTGARATAEIQQDPFLMSVEALAGVVEQAIHEAITVPFVAYNFGSAKATPKVKMSLVDSTSLTQLADYVLKLTQVGALLPDQELEDFLRARADLPPANPEAVKERKEDEERIRRMVVGVDPTAPPADELAKQQMEIAKQRGAAPGGPGAPKSSGGANKDPYGGNSRRDGRKNTKGPGAKKNGAPAGLGGRGQGSPRGPASQYADALGAEETVTLDEDMGYFDRWDYGAHDLMVDYDALELDMDAAPERFADATAASLYDLAREMASEVVTPLGQPARPETATTLRAGLLRCLEEMYDRGAGSVRDEVAGLAELIGLAPPSTLDAGARDRGREALGARAELAAKTIEGVMASALLAADLNHGDRGSAQAAAERAGARQLRKVALGHGSSALQQGRHDQAVALAEAGVPIVRARYSAKLDRNTCGPCAEADDGQARPLDDPVRLRNRPPNPLCDSNHSGDNLCRCVEVFEIEWPEGTDGPDSVTAMTGLDEIPTSGDLPGEPVPVYVRRVTDMLVAKGMPPVRALRMAVAVARKVCATGKVPVPGLRQVGAGVRSEACEAASWAATKGL